jgi:hypothetical protein
VVAAVSVSEAVGASTGAFELESASGADTHRDTSARAKKGRRAFSAARMLL